MKTTLLSITDLFRDTSSTFRERGFPEAEREAELIICHALNISRTEFYGDAIQVVESDLQVLNSIVEKRLCHEPLQYLTGYTEFYGLGFRVGRGVLIPRPETEVLVEEAVRLVNNALGLSSPAILDLCTGSGCIATAIAKNLPSARVVASDISAPALRYAVENAGVNGTENLVFVQGDLFEPVHWQSFHLIVSNPPYVKGDDLMSLQQEVSGYEPPEALDGGRDGLDFYRRILKAAPKYLRDGGYIVLELGLGQGVAVGEIAGECGLRVVRVLNDLSDIERVMVLEKLNNFSDKRLLEAI
ncbi:Peptide chain release factor N(5)-glutamine methyltransferase [hydrothermal vent metagenome]|uniref:peptide chain release factor N(5)-glutamine methyltransferase n=1 Tax=hydrothermal vent metagenome TaxID=652676 RepID=A0A3B1DEC1_9ZZZZ